MKRLETVNIDREFVHDYTNKAEPYSRLNVCVRLYEDDGPEPYEVIRSHYVAIGTYTPNDCQIEESQGDAKEAYTDKEEAYNAFSVQCVKAFTYQVTWYNAMKEAERQKEV